MIDDLILTFKTRWKVFLLSLGIQLLITTLLRVGVHAPKIFDALLLSNLTRQVQTLSSPVPSKPDVFGSVKPKLEQKENTFEIKKDTSWAPPALDPVPALAATGVNLPTDYNQASGFTVIDLDTGKVLLEKNGDKKLPIASLTKIMTAVVASDLANSSDTFTASKKAANVEPTRMGVTDGEKVGLNELLHALLMTSANDSAQMIKEGIDQKYGSEIFVRAMNEKAKFLGLKNTHFANPQGFDSPDNYSSADDLAVLSQYALQNYPAIKDVVQQDYQHYDANTNHPQIDLYNWNGLLDVYPGVYGVKIGNTNKAGYTTVVASERNGHHLLTVVLGAPGVLQRDMWAAEALDQGFAKYGLDPVSVTEVQLQAKYATWKYWN